MALIHIVFPKFNRYLKKESNFQESKLFLKKYLIFLKGFGIIRTCQVKIALAMERYSNGKEPHWKCGVPQGIVRSSRILSAIVDGYPKFGYPFSFSFCQNQGGNTLPEFDDRE